MVPPGVLLDAAALAPLPPPANGWAIASLISSLLLFCIPVLGGVFGIWFGILGLRSGRISGGRRVAAAGIAVGVSSLVLTSIAALSIAAAVRVQSHHVNPMQSEAPTESVPRLGE
jgi:hypothetical protein